MNCSVNCSVCLLVINVVHTGMTERCHFNVTTLTVDPHEKKKRLFAVYPFRQLGTEEQHGEQKWFSPKIDEYFNKRTIPNNHMHMSRQATKQAKTNKQRTISGNIIIDITLKGVQNLPVATGLQPDHEPTVQH